MKINAEANLRAGDASIIHDYVCHKIGSHLTPVQRRVLLSEIQTDAGNPFSRRSLHRDLMSILCSLESTGVIIVGASGLELSTR